jgi:hypothetical protein
MKEVKLRKYRVGYLVYIQRWKHSRRVSVWYILSQNKRNNVSSQRQHKAVQRIREKSKRTIRYEKTKDTISKKAAHTA